MDKFVVRTPRAPSSDIPDKKRKRGFTQATIESLRGVVVIEDIKRWKGILKDQDQPEEILVETLSQLQQKIPSRDVLKSTKIGHVVNRLTKHEKEPVATLASDVLKKWRTHFEDKLDKPKIEVKCCKKTESLRQAGRKHLSMALGQEGKTSLPELIERDVFHQHCNLANNDYRRTMRTITFALKHQDDLRGKVKNKFINPSELVKMYKKGSKSSSKR